MIDKRLFCVYLVVLCCLLVKSTSAACYPITTMHNQWNGGYMASIVVPVTKQVNGWTAELKFSHNTNSLDTWTSTITSTSSGKKSYFLKNISWNGNLSPGSTLEVAFVVDFPPSAYTSADACLIPSFDSGSSSATTTTKKASATTTTTKASVTTTTTASAPVSTNTKYNYDEVLKLGLLFYEAQRSGDLPSDNKISYRGDSSLNDGSDVGLDLSGGWHDAGDHVKFGFPMAGSATMILTGMVFLKDGYNAAGQYDMAKRQVKWALDYFIKCAQKSDRFYGQVGNGGTDHAWWGRPEEMTMSRPAYWVGGGQNSGGADLVGETAAALAAGSVVFSSDSSYASKLLSTAKSLYTMGKSLKGTYQSAISDAGSYYSSSGWQDEMAHGAAWLAYATSGSERNTYISESKSFLQSGTPSSLDWDDKRALVNFMLYHMTGETSYRSTVENYMQQWYKGGSVSYTPKGLAWRSQWGANRYAANTAFLATLAAKSGINKANNVAFAQQQIHYMLGDSGRSYLVGFGNNYPKRPHHKAASCPDPAVERVCDWDDFNANRDNPHVLQGALVGGPDQSDNYKDDRTDYVMNEVACDYNAGFVGAVAGLKYFAVNP